MGVSFLEIVFSLFSYLFMIVPVLIRVAFITLLERKILGLSQARKGPNKPRLGGLLQPFADAIKLFIKERVLISHRNKLIFVLAPGCSLVIILALVSNLPLRANSGFPLVGVLIIVLMSLGIYPVFVAGWRSNSKYSLLGSIRGVAQTISYEIALSLFLFTLFIFSGGFNLGPSLEINRFNVLAGAPLAGLTVVRAVAETNRTPFDFAEGESELVSGFNTEYGAGLFALIFMAEYGIIIFFRYFLAVLGASMAAMTSQILLFF